MADEVELVLGSSLHGQVLEVSDVLLESIVGRAVLLLEGPLSECVKLVVSGDLSIEGVEGGFKVFNEFVESLFSVGDSIVGHLVIPSFCVGGSSSSAHLVQGGHDFCSVRGVQGGVQGEIGLYGLDTMSGVIILSRKVRGEGGL